MEVERAWRGRSLIAGGILIWLAMAVPANAGMAELGLDADQDAAGGGRVRIRVNPTAVVDTEDTDTVDSILTKLADQINNDPQFSEFKATHAGGTNVIDILPEDPEDDEVNELKCGTSKEDIKKCKVTLSGTFGFIFAPGHPTGIGTVTVQINANAPVVVNTTPLTTPLGLLVDLKTALENQGLNVVVDVPGQFLEIESASSVSWDSSVGAGINSFLIGVGSTSSQAETGIPTLSEWGIVALIVVLLGTAVVLIRRRTGLRAG